MFGFHPSRHLSLRAKLGTAAFAAVVATALLSALLLVTARSARDVVQSVRETHEAVRTYSHLVSVVHEYQTSAYVIARVRTQQTRQALKLSRRRFDNALAAAQRVAARDNLRLAELIQQRGERVVEHLEHTEAVVGQIDTLLMTQGGRAAMMEAQRAIEPVRMLVRMMEEEIRKGDRETASATSRALSLTSLVVVACVVSLILAVGVSGVLHCLLLMRLRHGLKQLEQGALAFARGDMDHRVNLDGHDELAQLSSAFDSMAQLLSEKQAALQEVHAGLELAVRERTRELERANAELSEADARRRGFLADIGHELRTPLTVIRGEAQVALRTADRGDFNPLEVFERILKHTRDMSRMVEDMFLIARAEAGGLPLNLQRVDLRHLARRVADDFVALAAISGATICAIPGPPAHARIDPDRVRRAMAALVENALRHTHDHVSITLDVETGADGVALTVSDDGPGLNPALLPELFQRFRRGETHGEGSGLGLSLVKALAEAQGGRAWIENRSAGGARAVLQFPSHEE